MLLLGTPQSLHLWLRLCLAAALFGAAPARAHDPFDGNIQLIALDRKIEAKITLGYDATRTVLRGSTLTPAAAARITRATAGQSLINLPLDMADRLLTLRAGGQPVMPTAVLVAPSDSEINFMVIFPRPDGNAVEARAGYFDLVGDMRPGLLVAADSDRKVTMSAKLSKERPGATVALTAAGAGAGAGHTEVVGFGGFFLLGVGHILTGFDHLLFLLALLLPMRRFGAMLRIVTAFTLAHSLTLALAALDVVALPERVVEPLIAASIIVACLENTVRREAPANRYWLTGVFGLIHGFGFAAILRDTALAQGGNSIALPLLSFNLGVEAGQLAAAALAIPPLMRLRTREAFTRFGTPTLSLLVMLLSAYWLVGRLR